MADQQHLPYEEEAQLFSDIIEFITTRLPHSVGETIDHLDEAALSTQLFKNLSLSTDEELAEKGIHRDDLSKIAAAASGLFVAANRHKSRQ